jgi:hypothetical protein
MARGDVPAPKGCVADTVLVAVAITETLSPAVLATTSLLPSGLTARPNGPAPTGIVVTTVLVAVSITETVFAELLLT